MKSQLYLETIAEGRGTIIKDMYFTTPYKIMSPFTEENHIEIMQMSASAGMLDGDVFQGELIFRENSKVLYTSQSYEKVFKSRGKGAEKSLKIQAEEKTQVVYLPYPMIPFAGSEFQGDTEIHLNHPALFVYGDIFTCGRSGMGEVFQMKSYESRCRIYIEDKLDFVDHTLIAPEKFNYQMLGMWGDYTHNGLLYIYIDKPEFRNELLLSLQEVPKRKNILSGATACNQGLVLRILGKSGDEIYEEFRRIGERLLGVS